MNTIDTQLRESRTSTFEKAQAEYRELLAEIDSAGADHHGLDEDKLARLREVRTALGCTYTVEEDLRRWRTWRDAVAQYQSADKALRESNIDKLIADSEKRLRDAMDAVRAAQSAQADIERLRVPLIGRQSSLSAAMGSATRNLANAIRDGGILFAGETAPSLARTITTT